MASDENGSRSSLALWGVGMVFGGAVVLGVVLGNYLDHKLGTSPWLVTSGVILGTAAGFAELFRALRHLK